LPNANLNVYRPYGLAIIEDAGRRISEGSSVSVLQKGRKTKGRENRKKIRVRDAIVSFFLVKEDEPPIDGVLRCITKDRAYCHSDVGSLTAFDKASLVTSDQSRKNQSKAGGK
jgi:hypothetical protein